MRKRHPASRGLRIAALLIFIIALVTLFALTAAPTGEGVRSASSPSPTTPHINVAPVVVKHHVPPMAAQACHAVPRAILLRTYNGTDPARSGDIQMIPPFPSFVNGGLTHATPYNYTQHVPLMLYGPGFIRPGTYRDPAHLTDLSATTASLLKFNGFQAPDGRPLSSALRPAGDRGLPKLVVTMVWDSVGMDLLDQWPGSWPYLHGLRKHAAWFTDATVNSSPTNTPPSHAEIGTGAYPREHGIVDEYIRAHGHLVKPNYRGPQALRLPTLADIYDRAEGNRPVVAGLATLSAHLMMMGHGSDWPGGDKDIAVAHEVETADTAGDDTATKWNLPDSMAPYYTFPTYVNSPALRAVFSRAITELDQADGRYDGYWRDNSIGRLDNGFVTPARTPYQTALVEQVIKREHMGSDGVPDLLDVNYKVLDSLGHIFGTEGVELSDALKIQDADLRNFIAFLNQQVGHGNWVLELTADHGMQRDPAITGAFTIDADKLTEAVDAAFPSSHGKRAVLRTRPTQIWLNRGVLESEGYTPKQVAAFIAGLTQQEVAGAEEPIPDPNALAFDTVFPSSLFPQMPCLPQAKG